MAVSPIDLGHEVDYVDIDTAKVPYRFSVKLINRTFIFTVKGGAMKPVEIRKQIIPFVDYIDNADGLARRAPWCTVFVSETDTDISERDEYASVDVATVFLCFTVYDNGAEGQGHRDIMMLYELVKRHFLTQPVLAPNFYCRREMRLLLDSRETAPIFSSAMRLDFEEPILEAESELI
jgi:hypothetical protein